MSNVIYVINDLPKDTNFANPGYKDLAWVPHCLGSLEKYADKIGVDLKIISMNDFPAYQEIHKYSFSHYQKSTFVKVLLLHEFIKSDYDRFALLDLDMVVSKTAPDIFEAHKDEDFIMQYGFNEAVVKKNEIFLKDYLRAIPKDENVYWFNEKTQRNIPKYNLNLGCYIMSKKVVSEMVKVLPDQNTIIDFLETFGLIDNPIIEVLGEKKDFIDQDMYGYAYAKRMIHVQSMAYRQQWGCNFVVAVPNNLYGEHDNFHMEHSHVVPAMIRKMYEAKINGLDYITLWGDGSPLREFTYSKDIADALMLILNDYNSKDPINIGNSNEMSIQYLAEKIKEKIGFSGDIIWDTSMPSGQMRKPSSSETFKNMYPDFKFTDLEDGIEAVCKWFECSYPNIRGI